MQSMHSQGITVALFAAAGLAVVAGVHRTPAAGETPILLMNEGSLESMLLSSPSLKQDVLPLMVQRGTLLDGSMRSRAFQRMAIGGNPYENTWKGESIGGIRLESGTYDISDIDLALPADGFSWVVGRTYNCRQDDSGVHVSDGPQGKNWFQVSMPEIALHEATNDEDDVLYLIYGADRFAEYQRVSSSATTFQGRNGAAGVVHFEDGGVSDADTWTLHDQEGNEVVFFGFDGDASPAEGQIWKITDPDSNTAYVGNSSTKSTAISTGYTSEGYISIAYDTSGRKYTYTYANDAGSTKRLTEVKAEINEGGWTEVARVNYEYYGNESHGDIGDLELVETTTPLSDSGETLIKKKYYRYWDTGSGGAPHEIKMIVGPEGTRKYDYSVGSDFNEDFLSASDVALEPYSEAYFEYTSGQVTSLYFNGQCGCGSPAGDGEHTISYESNGSFSNTTDVYDTDWHSRAVVAKPDGSYATQYHDEVGQPLSQVITNGNPTGTVDVWATTITRAGATTGSDPRVGGWVTTVATPAASTGYTHSTGTINTSGTDGLVWSIAREGADALWGFASGRSWKEGTSGSGTKSEEFEYEFFSKGINTNEAYVYRPLILKSHGFPTETSQESNKETWESDAVESSSALAIDTISGKNPTVSTSNNGSNQATTWTQYFRDDSTLAFHVDESGVLVYTEYDDGRLVKRIEDADDDETSAYDLTAPLSNNEAVHRVTTYSYDQQGRISTKTAPDGQVTKYYYSKLADWRIVVLAYPDYDSGATPTYFGPVEYTVSNHAGAQEVEAVIALSGNSTTTALSSHIDESKSDPIDAVSVGTVVRLKSNIYDEAGAKITAQREYYDITGANFDTTEFGYDDMGQLWRIERPNGTIVRKVYDEIGRESEYWIGTNDYSFAGGSSIGPDNMVKTEGVQYDGNADGGNGHTTKRTRFVEDGAQDKREYNYTVDLRGRVLVEENPASPHKFSAYDNYGRLTATGSYSSVASIDASSDDPVSESTNRLELLAVFYDERGQVWKSTVHEILTSGAADESLDTLTWYDAVGRVIKKEGDQLEKLAYDRLGRLTDRYILANDNDVAYADADDVNGDIVLEEHQTRYESADSDDVLMRVRIERYHDDYGIGETTGALDSNSDNMDLKVTGSDVEGRTDITAFWYDDLSRLSDQVRYGTNDGADFNRSGLSVPSRSDDKLVTEYEYADDGTIKDVIDPEGLKTRTMYSDAGRLVTSIRNRVDGTPSGDNGEDDVHTRYSYADSMLTEVWVDLNGDDTKDTDDQVTKYTYGTSTGAGAGDSDIATGHLLSKIEYPDSGGGTDVISKAYNAQNEAVWRKDQSGNVLETEYDDLGRRSALKITTLGSGFDGAVRRLEWSYTDRDQLEKVTSYDAASDGSAVNEVKYDYDDWGNIDSFKQDKDGTVGASGYYEVAYAWAKATGGRNTLRKTSLTLSSGNVITFNYSSQVRHENETSRVLSLKDGGVVLVEYKYNGLGTVVGYDYPQPNIMWEMFGSSSGSYPDIDVFGRVTSSRWTTDLSTDVDFVDIDIAYDRNGNVTLVEDNVHTGFDWSYTIDDLDRLKRAQRGTWSGSITSEQEDQTWTLHQTSNWDHVSLDLEADEDYNGTGEYNDDRSYNKVNELDDRDLDDDGTNDVSLVFDAVGNLTDDGQNYEYTYDPFGRLRKITNSQSSNLLAEYKYNGLGFIVAVHEDTDSDGLVDGDDKWFYPVYDEKWRLVANYREDDSDPKEEWIYHDAGLDGQGGSSYVNDIVMRDKDANTSWTAAADGTLEERAYYCQNWRGDIAALVDSGGDQVETVAYSAYGVPIGLPGGDTESDGDADGTDGTTIDSWIATGPSAYDVRGDLDLDGDVDSTDKSLFTTGYSGQTLGRGALSSAGNRMGYAGHFSLPTGLWHARARNMETELGMWISRDPLGYALPEAALYTVNGGNPIAFRDPYGLSQDALVGAAAAGYAGTKALWKVNGFGPFGDPPRLPAPPPPPPGEETPYFEDGTIRNALVHCYWQCLLCQYIGAKAAKAWGDLRENPALPMFGADARASSTPDDPLGEDGGTPWGDPERKDGTRNHEGMDLRNNAHGRMCCRLIDWGFEQDCWSCCWGKASAGELTVVIGVNSTDITVSVDDDPQNK